VLQITRRAGVPLIINDRVDVAMAIGADGVHVGQSDMNAAEVRRLIGPGLILGVSTKSPEEALKAQADGADYVGSGAVYPTNTKVVTRELGVDGLQAVCGTPGLVIPVVAIGGISGAQRVSGHGCTATFVKPFYLMFFLIIFNPFYLMFFLIIFNPFYLMFIARFKVA
jgi:thiamine-phosphate diphosphorylase